MLAIESLQNKEFLYNLYINNKVSVETISASLQCSKGAVYVALRKFKLTLRKKHRCVELKKKLEDPTWLIKQYTDLGNSATEIARQFNVDDSNYARELIRNAIKKFKIEKHSKRYLRIKNNDKDYFNPVQDIIDGSLLGDATLWVPNNLKESAPLFRKGNINEDHVVLVASKLFLKDHEKRIKIIHNKLKDKKYKIFRITSLTHDSLWVYFNRWYPMSSSYKKVIPKDCSINKVALLHWFLDDGSTTYERGGKVVKLTLCTDSFNKNDQDILSKRIYKRYGLIFHVRKYRKNTFRMFLCGSQIETFYEIIGTCPIKSLAYKWKYPKRNKRDINYRKKKSMEMIR